MFNYKGFAKKRIEWGFEQIKFFTLPSPSGEGPGVRPIKKAPIIKSEPLY